MSENKKIAVVRIRGSVNLDPGVKKTLDLLRLYRKNYCVILPNTQVNVGMVKKVKDYVTWGDVTDETFNELVQKRGEEFKGPESDKKQKVKSNDFVEIDGKKLKKFFRLSPPVKGFGRKGIKRSFKEGGALGNRQEQINDLIKRMMM